jgi:hypothetical protein
MLHHGRRLALKKGQEKKAGKYKKAPMIDIHEERYWQKERGGVKGKGFGMYIIRIRSGRPGSEGSAPRPGGAGWFPGK